MNIDQFWGIIDKGKSSTEPEAVVAAELKNLPREEIVSYQEHFDDLFGKAYSWDLWGAAYIIEGGCSDDGFMDFRYGLISKGREVYEAALANPDSLATLETGDADDVEIGNELFGYVAMEVYEEKTGGSMPRNGSLHSEDPRGEQWDFDDGEENARRLPNLYAKYSKFYASEEAVKSIDSTPSKSKPWWKFW